MIQNIPLCVCRPSPKKVCLQFVPVAFHYAPPLSDALYCFSLSQLDAMDTCINFTIERWYPVANMSRYLPIRVYDYYAPGKVFHNCNIYRNILFRCPTPFFLSCVSKTRAQGQKPPCIIHLTTVNWGAGFRFEIR
jgi:hypothetical protein